MLGPTDNYLERRPRAKAAGITDGNRTRKRREGLTRTDWKEDRERKLQGLRTDRKEGCRTGKGKRKKELEAEARLGSPSGYRLSKGLS